MASAATQTQDSGAVTGAVRAAAHFDRRACLGRRRPAGGDPGGRRPRRRPRRRRPRPGVTMGAGAMLVGIAWRATGGRPPVAVMAIDALVMAVSTFVGCVTGSVPWLHLCVLCLWSLMGGLLVVVGNRGGVVGTQAIIAVVVFGRFSEPVPAALGLAGLVLTGGLAQVAPAEPRPLAAAVARSARPPPRPPTASWPSWRRASDDASALGAGRRRSTTPRQSLESPTLFGDSALMTLRSLVSEAYRLRIQLIALHALLRQHQPPGDRRPQRRRPQAAPTRRDGRCAGTARGSPGARWTHRVRPGPGRPGDRGPRRFGRRAAPAHRPS